MMRLTGRVPRQTPVEHLRLALQHSQDIFLADTGDEHPNSLYGNNRTPAHSFPARNDKLVIPESF